MKKRSFAGLTMAAMMTASALPMNAWADAPEVNHDETLTIEVYDVAANYQGMQTGWYAKEIKDRFNIELNIVAPQVSGDAASLYQTRCASGDLGDIIILDNADMQDCVDVGLIADISEELPNYENIMKYEEQINLFNDAMNEAIGKEGIYAIPAQMNSNGPTEYKEDTVYTMPRMEWDHYVEVGAPEMKNLDDLLDTLKKIQDAYPTNEAGDKTYALSLWPDWDGTSIENVNQITKWYGQEVNGSVLIGNDNSITPLTDKDGAYYKMLKFLYQANQMGLVDPDSATQDWNAACDKMRQGRVHLFWYNWQRGFWNSPEKGEARQNYCAIPVGDMNVFQASDTYYGDGRVWAIGSGVSDEDRARILEFMDWLCSPEGLTMQHIGQEDFIYTVNDDGTYTLTDVGLTRFSADPEVPEELGGGSWNDGNNQVNQWMVAGVEMNPVTGETFSSDYWASYIKQNDTATTKEWAEKFGAANEVEYLKENGMLEPVPSVNLALAIDTTDIALIRSQCGDQVKTTSWKAIFAADDAEFDQLWDDMCTTLNGLGWEQLVEFDTEKYQPVIAAREAAEE
jgi:putative aldouronate transport system substrate-binding protein